MKKRITAVFMAVLVFLLSAASAAPSLDTGLFNKAKNAVILISYGEYESAAEEIAPDGSIEPEKLREYVDKKARSVYNGTIQKDYSVAWYDGDRWIVAVPFSVPNDDAVGCLAFAAGDGTSFTAYKYMTWGDVVSGYSASDSVLWQDEYEGETVMAFADNG